MKISRTACKPIIPSKPKNSATMRREEDGHRHRLLELYKSRFGDHVPHIRRQDVRGFVDRKPVWLVRPLGLKTVQKTAETMEVETRRFYEAAGRRATDTGIRQLLGDLAEEERNHAAHGGTNYPDQTQRNRISTGETAVPPASHPTGSGRLNGRFGFNAGAAVCRRVRHPQQFSNFSRGPGRERRRGNQHGICRSAVRRWQPDRTRTSMGTRACVRLDDCAWAASAIPCPT